MEQVQIPKIQANVVFKHLQDLKPETSILVEQGGSRSGKTYNILNYLIAMCVTTWDDKVIDIVRKSFPSLRQSVMFDFIEILTKNGLYSEKNHNKTENIYRIGSNKFRFFSCDEPQKMRGPGRDILFCNEANELKLEDFRQLNMRTKELTIIDFNPSEEFHWIYDHLLIRNDVEFYVTTFEDNPFLPDRIKNEILRYKDTDENYWRIYGLGQRGISQTSIFTNWDLIDSLPEGGSIYYGLDFGYNHPTSLIKTVIIDGNVYSQELLYKSYLTVDDLIRELKNLGLGNSETIYGDCARPEMIEEIYRAGFNIHPTKKGPNSVKDGIDVLKRHNLFITKDSINLLKEIKSYKWKVDKNENVLDEPVKLNDDAVDALRYSINEFLQSRDSFDTLGESLF